jgi:site-specific DNA recombinase
MRAKARARQNQCSTLYSREHLGYFGARDRGTCTNRLTIRRQEVEERVLRALREKLMRRDFFDEFCREFAKEMNRLRMEQRAGLTSAQRELARMEARRKKSWWSRSWRACLAPRSKRADRDR